MQITKKKEHATPISCFFSSKNKSRTT